MEVKVKSSLAAMLLGVSSIFGGVSTASAETYYCQNCTSTSYIDGSYTFDIAAGTFDYSNLIFRPQYLPGISGTYDYSLATNNAPTESSLYDDDPDYWWYLVYEGFTGSGDVGEYYMEFATYLPLTSNVEIETYWSVGQRIGQFSYQYGYESGDDFGSFTFAPNAISAVPEPSTYAMMALGLFGVMWSSRRKKV